MLPATGLTACTSLITLILGELGLSNRGECLVFWPGAEQLSTSWSQKYILVVVFSAHIAWFTSLDYSTLSLPHSLTLSLSLSFSVYHTQTSRVSNRSLLNPIICTVNTTHDKVHPGWTISMPILKHGNSRFVSEVHNGKIALCNKCSLISSYQLLLFSGKQLFTNKKDRWRASSKIIYKKKLQILWGLALYLLIICIGTE